MSARELITEHLDLWTGAVTKKSSSGRGSNGKIELTGVKKLRELILELAVRGRLVEQDPREEPAHLILERLDSNVKKSKGKQRTSCGASQPSLPTGWACFRVGDYLDFQYGKYLPAKQRDDSGSIEVYGSNGVVGFHTKALTEEPCIVVGRKGSAGALNKALGPSWTTDVAYYVQPPQGFDFEFTYLLLQSLHLDQLGKGIKPGVNRNEAYALSASLPPQEEQHRIVQKVDELMALCDRLEQQTSDQLEAHETLVDSLLGTLTQSENATELADNWARLAAHFDTLFTTEQSIDKLKQTILQLAVMGRLVEQDAAMESSKELMRSIDLRKSELELAGDIKKGKPLPDIGPEELPNRIPRNWTVTRLGRIALQITDGAHHTPTYVSQGVPFLSVKDMSSGVLDFSDTRYISEEQHKELSRRCCPAKGDLLITKVGTTGIPVLVDVDKHFSIFVSVALVKFPTDLINGRFLCLLVASPWVKKQSEEGTEGVGNKNLVLRKIRNFVLPIPPLDEQALIVQKVDELMALCDHLKQRLNQASETRNQLAEAVVEGALN